MAKTKQKINPDHAIFVKLVAEIIAIGLMAMLADMNDGLGGVLAMIMVGWLLVWLMLNAKEIQGLFGKLQG